MVNTIIRGVKWGYKRIKKHDMYKQSISMTYKGGETISTGVGTAATVIILSISAFYFYMLMTRMFEYSEVSWNQNQRPIDYEKDIATINFTELDILLWWEVPKPIMSAEDFLEQADLQINHWKGVKQTRLMDGFEKKKLIEGNHIILHSIEFCTDIGVQEFQGSFTGVNDTDIIVLKLSTCVHPSDVNNLNYSGDSTSRHVLDNSFVNIMFQNSVVDLGSISSPIQNASVAVSPIYRWGVNQSYRVKITKNELFLEDSLVPLFFDGSFQTFYSYSIEKEREDPAINVYNNLVDGNIEFRFGLDNQVQQYRRRVLNIFDVLGTVGGIFEILEVTLGFCVGIVSYVVVKKEVKSSLQTADLRYQKIKSAYENISKMHQQCMGNGIGRNSQIESPNRVNASHKHIDQPKIHQNEPNVEDENKAEPPNFETFKDELNCIEIIYAIKELKQQVNYLLQKDSVFAKESKINRNLVLSENLRNRFTRPASLSSRIQNYNAFEVELEPSLQNHSQNKKIRRRVLPTRLTENDIQFNSMRRSGPPEEEKLVTPIQKWNQNLRRNISNAH